MNSSEQTTVATLAVFFALIFLLIMITMCCILRRGCRKETTQEGHKRYRFRSDWDKSGTMTSSETRITEAAPGANENSNQLNSNPNERQPSGALLRIEEETTADTYGKTEDITRGNTTTGPEEHNTNNRKQFVEINCESDEHRRLIHDGEATTTCSSFKTSLNLKKSLNCTGSTTKGKNEKLLKDTVESVRYPSNNSVKDGTNDLMAVE